MKPQNILSLIALIGLLFFIPGISTGQDNPEEQKDNLMIPRVAHPDSVADPQAGMMVFDTSDKLVWYFDGKKWIKFLATIPGEGYLRIEEDGSISLVGEATNWEDLRVAASATYASNSAPPVFERILNDGKGSRGVMAFFFEDTEESRKENEVFFEVQIPHQWRSGSGIRPHVHWVPTDNRTTGKVRWGLEYSWANINERLTNTTIIYGNSREIERGSAGLHVITPLPEIDGSGKGISSMLLCRLFRESSHPDDTYGTWAGFLEFDFHYEVSSLGSREEYVK